MIKIKLKEVVDNIFVAIVPDRYQRGMLFCRVQEFYESPSNKFRNKKFSIWDYFEWYSKQYGKGKFSYTSDFTGYNFPLCVAKECYEINQKETPYDEEMCKIIKSIFVKNKKQYLIGVDSIKNTTYDHEMAHAFYYTNQDYKIKMDLITNSISKSNFIKLKNNLKKIGYGNNVIKDEIQAYISTEKNSIITKGVSDADKIHKKFKSVFKEFI